MPVRCNGSIYYYSNSLTTIVSQCYSSSSPTLHISTSVNDASGSRSLPHPIQTHTLIFSYDSASYLLSILGIQPKHVPVLPKGSYTLYLPPQKGEIMPWKSTKPWSHEKPCSSSLKFNCLIESFISVIHFL